MNEHVYLQLHLGILPDSKPSDFKISNTLAGTVAQAGARADASGRGARLQAAIAHRDARNQT